MSVEARLSAATPGDHLIDLRAGRGVRAVDEWSRERHFHRSFGAEASRLTARFSAMPAVPAEAYDGFAYIVETTCSQPLPEPAA